MEDIKKKFDEILRRQQSTQVINRGIGPLSLLGIALVVLKAMRYINISWIWALAPFWIPLVIAVILVGLLLCVTAVLVKNAKVSMEIEEKETVEPEDAVNTPIDKTGSTEDSSDVSTIKEQAPVKPKKKRPKKKKEEPSNGEPKESTDTRVETDTNKGA